MVKVVTEKCLRDLITLNRQVIERIEACYTWVSDGHVINPPIMHIPVEEHNGDVDIKSAYVIGQPSFAVKIGAGFFDNPKRGLPSSPASVVSVNASTGQCQTIFLDNGYLTDVRTGAAGAVAAKHLGLTGPRPVAIIGTGSQARYQVQALHAIGAVSRLFFWGRDELKCRHYAEDLEKQLGITPQYGEPEKICQEADIVVTTTPSRKPIFKAPWLRPGHLIIAVGSDTPSKKELETEVLLKADRIVCDNNDQCRRLGELRGLSQTDRSELTSNPVDLGDITSGRHPGRTSDQDMIICDLTGMGVQDTAISLLAEEKVNTAGAGLVID